MSINATVAVIATIELTHSGTISEDVAGQVYELFHYILIPCTSILGIAGNVASIVILTRRGFTRCSNVLLLALSVSDVLFLIGINNIPKYMYVLSDPQGYSFSETINYVSYVLDMACSCARTIGLHCAMLIPVLITIERVLAIFFPLRAYFIITPRRTVIITSCLFIMNGVYFLYSYVLCKQLQQIVVQNITIGAMLFTDMYESDLRSGLYEFIYNVVNYMTGIIPISFVTVGCVVIGAQVVVLTKKRQQLTSGQTKKSTSTKVTSKTTKTLLSICVFYSVSSGFAFAIAYVTQVSPVAGDLPLKKVIMSVHNLLLCMNCAGDCIIYVGANTTLWRSNNKCSRRPDTRNTPKKAMLIDMIQH